MSAIVLAAPVPAAAREPAPGIRGAGSSAAIPGHYIVVLKDNASLRKTGVAARARSLTATHDGRVGAVWENALLGFSAEMSEAKALALAADPEVSYVAQDQVVRATDTQETPPSWGLDRADQRSLPLDGTYSYDLPVTGVTAYVVDSGIRITHNDFGGRAQYGWNTVDNLPNANDCDGHGTHVAGTIGGATYGVAKAVRLVAVRVLNCAGEGTVKQIVDGVNWVTAHAVRPAVANMSIGLTCYSDPAHTIPVDCPPGVAAPIDDALANSINSGITWVVAAGNDRLDACGEPIAGVGAAITVGATNNADAIASYSNWGHCVNIFAPGGDYDAAGNTPPGIGITSAGIGSDNDTKSTSGTSMAAPHVAGAVALLLSRPGWATRTPAQITTELLTNWATTGVITNIGGSDSPNKLLYTNPPPAAGGSSIAVAHNNDGRLDVFGVNGSGTMFFRTQTSANANSWSAWTGSSDSTWYSVAAETDGGGHIDVSGHPEVGGHIELVGLRRSALDVWHRNQAFVNSNSWFGWNSHDGTLTSATAARQEDGRLVLFGANRQGQAWTRTQTGLGSLVYTPWTALPLAGTVRSVAAELNGNGLVEVFALTGTGQIWHRWQTGHNSAAYTPWIQLDGLLTTVAVARNASGALELFGANRAGQAFHRQAGLGVNNWFSWSQFDAPAAVGPLQSVAADTNADGRVELFAVARTGQIWHRWQDAADTDRYSPWVQLDGLLRP